MGVYTNYIASREGRGVYQMSTLVYNPYRVEVPIELFLTSIDPLLALLALPALPVLPTLLALPALLLVQKSES